MKKYLVLMVIAAFFVTLPTQAQLKWGAKAGVNLSSISTNGDFYKNSDNYTGFQVGPMMEFTVPIVGIGVDAALLYSQTGFVVDDKTVKNGNLLVPVNLKYKLSLLDLVGAYATAGPYIGLKLFGDDKKFDTSSAINKIESESFGAGLNFGLGVELLGKLQVGANYQLGLTEDYKSFQDASLGGKVFGEKTRVWSITAAFFF